MKKLYIAYFYKPSDEYDAVIFVAEENKSIENQFKRYANWAWGIKIKDEDIFGIYEVGELEDCYGNEYEFKYTLSQKKVC